MGPEPGAVPAAVAVRLPFSQKPAPVRAEKTHGIYGAVLIIMILRARGFGDPARWMCQLNPVSMGSVPSMAYSLLGLFPGFLCFEPPRCSVLGKVSSPEFLTSWCRGEEIDHFRAEPPVRLGRASIGPCAA
jgi:hypothetical protein